MYVSIQYKLSSLKLIESDSQIEHKHINQVKEKYLTHIGFDSII